MVWSEVGWRGGGGGGGGATSEKADKTAREREREEWAAEFEKEECQGYSQDTGHREVSVSGYN